MEISGNICETPSIVVEIRIRVFPKLPLTRRSRPFLIYFIKFILVIHKFGGK